MKGLDQHIQDPPIPGNPQREEEPEKQKAICALCEGFVECDLISFTPPPNEPQKDMRRYVCPDCQKVIGELWAEEHDLMDTDEAANWARENMEPQINEAND